MRQVVGRNVETDPFERSSRKRNIFWRRQDIEDGTYISPEGAVTKA